MNFITDFLAKILDGFKQKNPTVFMVIAGLLLAIYYVSGYLLDFVSPDGTALISEGVRTLLVTVQNALVVILTLIGAHTPRKVSASQEEVKSK